jgi:hypothetical protein
MDKFKLYEADVAAKEADTDTPAKPAGVTEPKKKELDKTIPTRDMGEIYKKIEPFIKRYAFNSFRNVQRINTGIMMLTFGGSFAKLETGVLYELLDSKFNDEFTIQKNRYDSDSSTITMVIF